MSIVESFTLFFRSKRGKCPNPHEKNVLLTEIIFGNVDDIFQITTKQLDYLQQNNMFEMYGANDIELGDWEMDDETICKHLNISYKGEVKIPLNGPKKVEIKEVVVKLLRNTLDIDIKKIVF